MNVFVIPSWYPTKKNPISGIFFKEQTEYLAKNFPKYNFALSNWGQSDQSLHLTKSNIFNAAETFRYYRHEISEVKELYPNLLEYYTPALSWSPKVFSGNIQQITKVNKTHFDSFQKRVGKVDLIHAHVGYPAGYIAMNLAIEHNIPYVITEHMAPFPFPQYLHRNGKLKRFLYEPLAKANKVVAVSPMLVNAIAEYGLDKPIYIPNVIDEDFFNPGIADLSENFTFFTLCLISPQKGIDDLLEAAKLLVKKHSSIQLRIGGAGAQLEKYKALSVKHGLENNVVWLGALSREQAKEEFLKCHAFVLPSYYETFGVVFAEAIACGKPVIATRCGGPEAIVNENNGLVVDVGDIAAITESMSWMKENYHLFDPVTIRKDFKLRFSKKAVLPQIINTYKSILCAG